MIKLTLKQLIIVHIAMYITCGFITFAVSNMHEITLEEDQLAVLQVGMTEHLCGSGFVKLSITNSGQWFYLT